MFPVYVNVFFVYFSKGDGRDCTFDVRGEGGSAFIFGSNLPIFWLHSARL